MTLLAAHTASSSPSLDFLTRNAAGQSGDLYQSDYDVYLHVLIGLRVATNTQAIYYRVSTNGATFAAGGSDYQYDYFVWRAGGSGFGGGNGSAIVVSSITLSNDSTYGLSGELWLHDLNNASKYKGMTGKIRAKDSSPAFIVAEIGGHYSATTAIRGCQFLASSGNLADGTVRVYGVPQ